AGDTVAGESRVEIVGPGEVSSGARVDSAVPGQGAGDLANAVGPEVEADAGIVVADGSQGLGAGVHAHKGEDEFIGHALVVRVFHALHRVHVPGSFAVAVHHSVEGFGDTLPAAVAIHGVVAAVDAGDFAGVVLAHLLPQLLEIAGAVGRKSVA